MAGELIETGLQIGTIFNVFIGIAGIVIGILLNRLFTVVNRLEDKDATLAEKINKIAVDLPTNYVMKPDLQLFEDRIMDKLDKIMEKLDGKVDKKKNQ